MFSEDTTLFAEQNPKMPLGKPKYCLSVMEYHQDVENRYL